MASLGPDARCHPYDHERERREWVVPVTTRLMVAPLDSPTHSAGASSAVPEPVRLYELICLALLVHRPGSARLGARCTQCEQPWPCPQLRLAYRLREGF